MKIIFDIGGTNTRISFVQSGQVGKVLKLGTPPDIESAKRIITEAIKGISCGEKIESIIGGAPGIIRDGAIVDAQNLPEWNGFNLQNFLRENLCARSFVYNDAELAALGESTYGAGRNAAIVSYLCVGTGVGGARVVDGVIDRHSFGFEPGRQIINVTTGETLEALIGGAALSKKYGKKPEELGPEIFQKLAPVLAIGAYNTIMLWSPDVLVLGGSVMNEDTAFKIKHIQKYLEQIARGKTLPEVKTSELRDSAGLWGALAISRAEDTI